jgi:hypothetical protein
MMDQSTTSSTRLADAEWFLASLPNELAVMPREDRVNGLRRFVAALQPHVDYLAMKTGNKTEESKSRALPPVPRAWWRDPATIPARSSLYDGHYFPPHHRRHHRRRRTRQDDLSHL